MSLWVNAGAIKDLPGPGGMQSREINGRKLIVGIADGNPFACEDRCPHAGVPLSLGQLTGTEIRCHKHGWTFDVRTGESVPDASAFCLMTMPCEMREGDLWVDIGRAD